MHTNSQTQETSKMSEPGVKHDNGKPMFRLLPRTAWLSVVQVLTFGARKYSPDNWNKVPDLENRYSDAALRHIHAFLAGHWEDQESGLPHLAHAICSLLFILEFRLQEGNMDNQDAGHSCKYCKGTRDSTT